MFSILSLIFQISDDSRKQAIEKDLGNLNDNARKILNNCWAFTSEVLPDVKSIIEKLDNEFFISNVVTGNLEESDLKWMQYNLGKESFPSK